MPTVDDVISAICEAGNIHKEDGELIGRRLREAGLLPTVTGGVGNKGGAKVCPEDAALIFLALASGQKGKEAAAVASMLYGLPLTGVEVHPLTLSGSPVMGHEEAERLRLGTLDICPGQLGDALAWAFSYGDLQIALSLFLGRHEPAAVLQIGAVPNGCPAMVYVSFGDVVATNDVPLSSVVMARTGLLAAVQRLCDGMDLGETGLGDDLRHGVAGTA